MLCYRQSRCLDNRNIDAEIITPADITATGQSVAITATAKTTADSARPDSLLDGKTSQRIALRPARSLFSPQGSLVWIIGALGIWACIVPWLTHGWLWF